MFLSRILKKAWTIYRTKGIGELSNKTKEYVQEKVDAIRWQSCRLRNKTAIANLGGYKLCLHSKDAGISRELALYGVHEPQTTKILKSILKPGFVVIDIGSNIGYYAILESLMIGENGKVIAVEPEPRNYDLLIKNIEMNSAVNVTSFPVAIGPEDGVGKLYVTKQSNLNSMCKPVNGERINSDVDNYIDVDVRSLDSLIRGFEFSRVDLIRMDIEGFESVVVKGMSNIITKFQPRLLIEVHAWKAGYSSTRNFLTQLKSLGYEVEHVIDRDEDFKWKTHHHGVKTISIDELIKNLEKYRVAMVFFTNSGNISHPKRV